MFFWQTGCLFDSKVRQVTANFRRFCTRSTDTVSVRVLCCLAWLLIVWQRRRSRSEPFYGMLRSHAARRCLYGLHLTAVRRIRVLSVAFIAGFISWNDAVRLRPKGVRKGRIVRCRVRVLAGPDHPWGWWGWSLRARATIGARTAWYNENFPSLWAPKCLLQMFYERLAVASKP